MDTQNPKVGVGVMVMKDGKVLLHKRKGAHGEGEWSFPGGHLEHLESFEDCARREVQEECGIAIKNIRFHFFANVRHYAPRHYVHVGLVAEWESGEPQVLEPDRCDGPWQWRALEDLPQPLFAMCRIALDAHKTGKQYYDAEEVEKFLDAQGSRNL